MSDNKITDTTGLFLSYINDEINQIREDIKMPGWTNWAVMAAVASIIWLLIIEVEKGVFKIEQICLIYIILVLFSSFLRNLYELLKPITSDNRIRYISIDLIFKEKRFTFVINIFQACLMVYLLWNFSSQSGTVPYYLAIISYGIYIISPLIIYLGYFISRKIYNYNLYFPDNKNAYMPIGFSLSSKRKSKVTLNLYALPSITMPIIYLYLSFKYSQLYIYLFGLSLDPTVFSNFRIAILCFSILTLLRLFIFNEETSPTLKELVDIRRDLIFGNIDLEMAKKLTEVSLSGLNKSTIIQMETRNCITTLQKIDAELNKAEQKIKIASSELEKNNTNDLDAQRTLWETFRDATLAHFRVARSIYLSDKSLRLGLGVFLRVYGPIEPDNTNFIESLKKLDEIYKEVKQKYDQTIGKWLYLVDEYEGNSTKNLWREIAVSELAADLQKKNAE